MARKIELVEFHNTEVYSPSKSQEGSNAYYLEYCLHGCHRPNYAACLNKIDTVQIGTALLNDSGCTAAIERQECPAQRMRKEEQSEGRAIYYMNRVKLREHQCANAELMGVRLGSQVKREMLSAPTPSSKGQSNSVPQGIPHKPQPKDEAMSYSDAINKKLKSLRQTSAGGALTEDGKAVNSKNEVTGDLSTKSTKGDGLKVSTQGMSLLEIARLAKQATTHTSTN
ncbi:hypothetical protein [Acinetobacter brisouii]|uniref:hypothetical protein n=1 Tax=Acinetobacter brisouii TaxID=396323 RepID=UPI00124CE004|nr:hypothetical protein [Acinetobacter brisouii]